MKVELKGFLSCEALEDLRSKTQEEANKELNDDVTSSSNKNDVFRHEFTLTIDVNEGEPNDGSGETTSN